MAGRPVEGFPIDRAEVGRLFPADTGPMIGLCLGQQGRPGELVFILADDVAFNTACAILQVMNVQPSDLIDIWPDADAGPESERP